MIVYNETNHILSIRNCTNKKLKQLTLSTVQPSSPQTVRYVHLLRTRYFLLLVVIFITVSYMRLLFASNGSLCSLSASLLLLNCLNNSRRLFPLVTIGSSSPLCAFAIYFASCLYHRFPRSTSSHLRPICLSSHPSVLLHKNVGGTPIRSVPPTYALANTLYSSDYFFASAFCLRFLLY